jgi:DNA-binding response OmpR family regulator
MPRILLVEDDRAVQKLMAKALASLGEVQVFATGEDALRALKESADVAVDAVILDLGLPGMSGVRVCEILRAEQACALAVIVVVSGRTSVADHALALEAGADHYLQKPIRPRQLEEELRRLLAERAGGR